MTLTDFTLHFSCCFTKILHNAGKVLLKRFTLTFSGANLHIKTISTNYNVLFDDVLELKT